MRMISKHSVAPAHWRLSLSDSSHPNYLHFLCQMFTFFCSYLSPVSVMLKRSILQNLGMHITCSALRAFKGAYILIIVLFLQNDKIIAHLFPPPPKNSESFSSGHRASRVWHTHFCFQISLLFLPLLSDGNVKWRPFKLSAFPPLTLFLYYHSQYPEFCSLTSITVINWMISK